MDQITKEYQRLLPLWQIEREDYKFSSNTSDYWEGPHGQAIIALGPAIIPFLIQQVKAGDFWFNVPLNIFIGTQIESKPGLVSEQTRSKLYSDWWEIGNQKLKT